METVEVTGADRPLTARAAWKSLQGHFQKIRQLHLRELFASETERDALGRLVSRLSTAPGQSGPVLVD